jgi:hypothetical protein
VDAQLKGGVERVCIVAENFNFECDFDLRLDLNSDDHYGATTHCLPSSAL